MTRAIVTVLTAAAVAFAAPPALADPVKVDCSMDTFAQQTLTGGADTYTGAAWGHVVSNVADAPVEVRCYVSVDGAEVASTPLGSGVMLASTTGQVTYTAGDTQDVDLCAEWSAGSSGSRVCFETETTQFPPEEVVELADEAAGVLVDLVNSLDPSDATACSVLTLLSGDWGFGLYVDDDGDVYRDETRVLDCPPLDDPHPPGPGESPWLYHVGKLLPSELD